MPVYDFTTCVIKSDGILTAELAQALQKSVAILEDVPLDSKDWHPGSEDQVLDLVHPSLWPLVYGRSRVLQDRVINLENALVSCGTAVILSAPGTEQTTHVFGEGDFYRPGEVMLSNKFQWLPCDADLNPETGKVKIMSYINNLHPVQHAHLYPIIEQLIEKFLPAWDVIYNWEMQFSVQRLTTIEAVYEECPCPKLCQENDSYGCAPWRRPLNEDGEPRYEEEEEDYDEITYKKIQEYKENPKRSRLDDAWFASTHSARLPDADPAAESYVKISPSDVKSKGFFNGKKQLQVIAKLANIHLTPERPLYKGGSCHTKGLLNEHIVSTAIYYYGSENTTDCTLNFRTSADKEDLAAELNYEQDKHDPIERRFALELRGSIFQDVGSVLTRPGRALLFPNLL
jgi:hypothetical protein